ncbi:MAG TPA: glycosyltransferase [Acidimicrobiales bacterium]|nr:glycosyltransferase [Acidimicrobiales bacterium]
MPPRRVLVSAVPAIGHVVPLLDLARALQAAGHEVRFATHPQSHGLVTDAGLRPVAAGMGTVEMAAERRRRWPETDTQPATVWATRMWAQIMAPSTLADLVTAVEDWRPDVVVHDEGEYAAPVVAAHAGVPWITHGWGSPLRPVGELDELEDLAAPLWAPCGLDVPPSAGLYAHALVNPCPPILQADAPGAAVVWPLRPRPLATPGTPPLAQPDADAYVGFGTVPHFADAPDELAAAVRACTARGLRVVVTAPSPELRRALVAIDPHRVEAYAFVPLAEVVRSCRVVISHAGAGTVLAALGAGVPVVLVPRGSPSQVRMADACHRAGVGRRCGSDPADVADALDQVLDGPAIKAAAETAAAQIAALPTASEVVARIEHLAGA